MCWCVWRAGHVWCPEAEADCRVGVASGPPMLRSIEGQQPGWATAELCLHQPSQCQAVKRRAHHPHHSDITIVTRDLSRSISLWCDEQDDINWPCQLKVGINYETFFYVVLWNKGLCVYKLFGLSLFPQVHHCLLALNPYYYFPVKQKISQSLNWYLLPFDVSLCW